MEHIITQKSEKNQKSLKNKAEINMVQIKVWINLMLQPTQVAPLVVSVTLSHDQDVHDHGWQPRTH